MIVELMISLVLHVEAQAPAQAAGGSAAAKQPAWRRSLPPNGAVMDMQNIDALLAHVEPVYQHKCGRILRGEASTFSQMWQDWYLFHVYGARAPPRFPDI